MLRLLLVDDEPLFREGLRDTMDWKSMGVELAGEAFNGKEALVFLEQNRVDLVLTDIRMPEMDGLELIRRASPLYPDLGFIVLSAYDEFPLVKQAFQQGIADYILKPEINSKELGDIIRRLQERGKKHSDSESGDEYARHNRKLYRQQLLKNTVEQKLSSPGGAGIDDFFRSDGSEAVYSAVFALRRASGFECPRLTEQSANDALLTLDSYLTDSEGWLGYRDGHQIVLFLRPSAFREHVDWQMFSRLTESMRSEMEKTVIKSFPGLTVCAGFADPEPSTSLWRKKREAVRACEYAFFRGCGKTIAYTHYKRSLGYEAADTEGRFQSFVMLLEQRDWNGLMEAVSELQLPGLRCNASEADSVENLFRRYYFHLQSFLGQIGMDHSPAMVLLLDHFKCLEAGRAVLEEYNLWLRKCISMICSQGESRFTLSQKVMDYVQRNYHNDISLSSAAEELEMNPSYVSRTFSKETGTGFAQYLLQFRIRKSIELMEKTPDRFYEIAEKVGFSNPESFSRGFKKVTGVSPVKYGHKK